MTEAMKVFTIGNKCPNCGSNQFSISSPKPGMPRPEHWESGILGEGDCSSCHRKFLVKLDPELENSFSSLLMYYEKHYHEWFSNANMRMIIHYLFRFKL